MPYLIETITSYKVVGTQKDVVASVETIVFPYTGPCAEGEAQYAALTPAQKAALSRIVPAHGPLRNCSGAGDTITDVTSDDDTDDEPTGNPTDTITDVTSDDDTDDESTSPLPNDGSAWTGGNPGETDDEGTATTYSDPVILDPNA